MRQPSPIDGLMNKNYTPELTSGDIVADARSATQNVNEMVLAKNIADMICKRYPIEKGHRWGVHIDGHGGVLHIYNLNLSLKWGYTLKLVQVINDPDFKMAVRAAGEILERFDVRRSKISDAANDIGIIPTDFTGNFVFDGHCALKYGREIKSRVATKKPSMVNVAASQQAQRLVFS